MVNAARTTREVNTFLHVTYDTEADEDSQGDSGDSMTTHSDGHSSSGRAISGIYTNSSARSSHGTSGLDPQGYSPSNTLQTES